MISKDKAGINVNLPLLLRIGLGGVFIYAGASIITSPGRWIDFLPEWLSLVAQDQAFLMFYGALELILGIILLAGVFLPASSMIAFLNLLLIMTLTGITDATFGNFGLSMAALALFVLSVKEKNERRRN